MLIVSNILLWIAVLLQLVAIVSLGRKVRLIGKNAEGGAKRISLYSSGKDTEPASSAGTRSIKPRVEGGEGRTLLLYVSDQGQVSPRLAGEAEMLARLEGLQLLVIKTDGAGAVAQGAGPPLPGDKGARKQVRGSRNRPAGRTLPYAMIVDGEGRVIAQGEAGSRAELVKVLARGSVAASQGPLPQKDLAGRELSSKVTPP